MKPKCSNQAAGERGHIYPTLTPDSQNYTFPTSTVFEIRSLHAS